MTAPLVQHYGPGQFILGPVGSISLDQASVLEDSEPMPSGTVLAVNPSGVFVRHVAGAADHAGQAKAVLVTPLPAGTSPGAATVVARMAEVKRQLLNDGAAIPASTVQQLSAAHIVVR